MVKLAIAAVLTISVANADQQSAEETVKARQHNLKDLGGAFKAVRDQIRKSEPDLTQVQQATAQIDQLASEMKQWFPQGSGPSEDIETDAKAEIWSDPQGFAAALTRFQQEAPKLSAFAKVGDTDGLKKHVGVVGGACKGCHDKYRVPQD
jgi:cytochrome c556